MTLTLHQFYWNGIFETSKNNLNTRIHTTTTFSGLARCNICGKWVDRYYLQRHQSIVHLGRRPYQCRFCAKSFGQSGNRNAHERNVHQAPRQSKPPPGHFMLVHHPPSDRPSPGPWLVICCLCTEYSLFTVISVTDQEKIKMLNRDQIRI